MARSEITTYREVLSNTILSSSSDRWCFLTSDLDLLAESAKTLQDSDTGETTVEWLCDSDVLNELERDFLVVTKANDLVTDGVLSVRASTDRTTDLRTLLLTPETAITLLPLGGGDVARVDVDDPDVHGRLWDIYESAWDIAVPYSFDSPPYSRLLALAEDKLGPDLRGDIDTAYGTVESRAPSDRPEPVIIALLVSAKHRLLLTDVVDWCETSGLASQGTVSKLKQRLEDLGLVETESERVGVGRPRQRLALADESYESMPADDLVANVQAVLD